MEENGKAVELKYLQRDLQQLQEAMHEKADRGELSKDIVQRHEERLRLIEQAIATIKEHKPFSWARHGAPLIAAIGLFVSGIVGAASFVRASDLREIHDGADRAAKTLNEIRDGVNSIDKKITQFREEQIRDQVRLDALESKHR